MWQELLMDPMPAYEDNFRTVTWRINKHKIIRTAHCTLDGNPVELEVISPSDTVDNQIDIKEDHKKDKMDSKGEKICDVALTKGPIGFALVDGVLVLRFGKETLFLKRFKATAPVATADVQP
jgi:hypothetical protein